MLRILVSKTTNNGKRLYLRRDKPSYNKVLTYPFLNVIAFRYLWVWNKGA